MEEAAHVEDFVSGLAASFVGIDLYLVKWYIIIEEDPASFVGIDLCIVSDISLLKYIQHLNCHTFNAIAVADAQWLGFPALP